MHHFLTRKIGFRVNSSFIIDWPASKILISFYKTDFFLIFSVPLWIFKKISKSWNLTYLRVLKVQKQCSKFQNIKLIKKKVIDTQKCTQVAWPPLFYWFLTYNANFEVSWLLNRLSVCAEIFRIILTYIRLSSGKSHQNLR